MTAAAATRVLVLGVPDALDDEIARWQADDGLCLRYVGGPRDVDRIDVGATHVIVRDGSGRSEDLDDCRAFVQSVLARCDRLVAVIQTHPEPRTAETHAYDRWLKTASGIHRAAHLCVIWHDEVCTTVVDCRGVRHRLETPLAAQHIARPARLIRRQLVAGEPHDLEYTAMRNL